MDIVSGSCSLIIRGRETLNIDEINTRLNIKPTEVYIKGNKFSKSSGDITKDVWIYKHTIKKEEDLNTPVISIINDLRPHKQYLNELTNSVDIYVKLYIQSDLAQIGFELLPEVIVGLAELNLKVEFSILSWGGVDN